MCVCMCMYIYIYIYKMYLPIYKETEPIWNTATSIHLLQFYHFKNPYNFRYYSFSMLESTETSVNSRHSLTLNQIHKLMQTPTFRLHWAYKLMLDYINTTVTCFVSVKPGQLGRTAMIIGIYLRSHIETCCD